MRVYKLDIPMNESIGCQGSGLAIVLLRNRRECNLGMIFFFFSIIQRVCMADTQLQFGIRWRASGLVACAEKRMQQQHSDLFGICIPSSSTCH